MGHDASKVLLGSTQSSLKEVDNYAGLVEAGKLVRLKSDGSISLLKADGGVLGISLGLSLSDNSRTAVCRSGLRVPVLLTAAFTPVIGAQCSVDDITGLGKAAGAGVSGLNAIYVSGILTGVKEDGTTANVALIDFPGGL